MRLPEHARHIVRPFPLREVIEELKKQKKLDAQTLVYIKQLFASDRARTFVYLEKSFGRQRTNKNCNLRWG